MDFRTSKAAGGGCFPSQTQRPRKQKTSKLQILGTNFQGPVDLD